MGKKSYEATSPILEATAQAPRLSREDERELVRAARSGNQEAAHRLIAAHLPLVARIAARYRQQRARTVYHEGSRQEAAPSFQWEDAFQEGVVGLRTAIKRFEPDKGARFATFAEKFVHGHIKRALSNQAHTIRLPVHQQAAVTRVDKAREELRKNLEREPSRREVAAAVGMSGAELEEIDRVADEPVSLSTPIALDEDDTSDLHDLIEDGQVEADQIVPLPSPADLAERTNVARIVAAVLSALLPYERDLLRLRYGFGWFFGEDVEGVPPAEAAHRLRIRRATLDKSERAALTKARETLALMGYGPELLAAFEVRRRRIR